MPKMMQYDEKARRSLLKGIQILARAVKVTLGPKGRNVIIKKEMGAFFSTKDGVTVAKEIALKDKFENIGATLVKEAAAKTADIVGDGTTTAIVLAEAIFQEGAKNITAGADPGTVKRGMEKGLKTVLESLDEMATPIRSDEEIRQVAKISSNNDEEIGNIISEAMKKVGKDGIITVADAKGIETKLEVVEGMQIDQGYSSVYFINNPEKMVVELEDPLIFISEKKLSSAMDAVHLLQKVMEHGPRALLIIADDIETDALAALVVNRVKGKLPICAIKAPGFGDRKSALLQDIAIMTKGEVFSEDKGQRLENIDIATLGKAKRIKIGKNDTTIIEGNGNVQEIQKRVAQIKFELGLSTSDYDKEKLEKRLAKLLGGIAVMYVGAATEAEMKEKKYRVEDALHATRAAAFGGIVPGGGVAFIRALENLEKIDLQTDEQIGIEILKNALKAPSRTIAANAGLQGDLVVEKIKEHKGSWGFNGLTNKFSDLVKDGVVDPVLVVKTALQNAVSIAALLLTISTVITEKKKPQDTTSPMGGGGMPPGMGGFGGMGGMGGMDSMGGMDMGGF